MTTPPGGYYTAAPQIDIGWLTRGWDTYKSQAGLWIAVMLLVSLLLLPLMAVIAYLTGYASVLAYSINVYSSALRGAHTPFAPPPGLLQQYGSSALFSILVGGLYYVAFGCYYRLALAQLRGEPVRIGTAFSALASFPALFAAGIITQIVTVIGFYLCYLPGLILQGLFMLVPLLIVDRKAGPIAALTESVGLLKSQWIMVALFYFLGMLLAGAGALLLGVGVFVTYPLFFLGVTMAYLALTQPAQPLPGYGQAQPGVWPPPPTVGLAPPVWGQTPTPDPPPGQTFPEQTPPRTGLGGEPLDNPPPGTP